MEGEKGSKTRKGDALAREKLLEIAEKIYNQFEEEVVPSVSLPSRTKAKPGILRRSDVLVYGDNESEPRSITRSNET